MGDETAGERLIRSLAAADDSESLSALIVEAGRMKDRLDQLERALGKDVGLWLDLVDERSGDRAVVVVDRALAESRQLATVFRQTLAEIERRQGGDNAGGRDDDDGAPAWM